ncbi:MAG: HD domain-containing protein [Thermoleophilia bacterium]
MPQAGIPAVGTYPDLPPGLPYEYIRMFEIAEPSLQTRFNDLHAKIGAQIVVELLRRDGGDPRIAVPAILLHDLGWNEVPEELRRSAFGPGSNDAELNRQHELAGVRLAGRLLEEVGYPPHLTAEILRIIDGHDSRPLSETLEEAIVKDADKMWRVTKLGFPATLQNLETLTPQEVHDFIAVRAFSWFLAPSALEMVREQLDARRVEYGLAPAPDIAPPPGFGVGDAHTYEFDEAGA